MKYKNLISPILWVIACCVSLCGFASSQTISDYFSRIPHQVFCEAKPAELLKLAQKGQGVVDTKNGYVRLDGDGAQVSLQIALFRYKDQNPLLVVAWGDLEEKDFTHLTIFQEQNGKMKVADRKLFPINDSKKLSFELPRQGRTIIVRKHSGEVSSRWTWNGTSFLHDAK